MMRGHEHDHDKEREEELAVDPAELELLAYVDGELDGDDLAAFEARLRTDRLLAARVRAFEGVGQFLRSDADRIYGAARVDTIADDVMARLRRDEASTEPQARRSARLADVIPMSAPMSVSPPTSIRTRQTKTTVLWVTFGAVAAAAAVMFFAVSNPKQDTPVATPTQKASATDTVAIVNTAPVPTSDPTIMPPAPVTASHLESGVEVEDLEVGQGATIIYRGDEEGSSPVVWITAAREGSK